MTGQIIGLLNIEHAKGKNIFRQMLSQVGKRSGDSQFWKSLMEVKNQFLEEGCFMVHSGHQMAFWKDLWIGDKPLMEQFSSLYNLARNKRGTVAQVLSTSPLNFSFRRALVG
jgi:hypothetical protein